MTTGERRVSDYQYGFDGMTAERMREKMRIGWKSSETPCGRGSELAHAALVTRLLPVLCNEENLTVINDAGAGDLHWEQYVEWPDATVYRAFDLVPRHADVRELDITTQVMPQADLILCRHVLNHLSCKLAIDALDNFRESGSKYLLITNCDNQVDYWTACGLMLEKPINTWNDATKWWLELHDLNSDFFRVAGR